MRTTTLRRIGAFSAVLAFTGTTLPAAPAGATAAPLITVFELGGTYSGPGSTLPRITRTGDLLSVDMSALGRPAATGTVVGAETISVTFPDDATYSGTLLPPGTIKWSNQTLWHRTRPVPNVEGRTVARATAALAYAEFTRGAVTPSVTAGCHHIAVVVEQTPRAGTPAIPGSRVDLVAERPPGRHCH